MSIVLFVAKTSFSFVETLGWYSIDCGTDELRIGDDLIVWESDEDYTQTGTNNLVLEKQPLEEMNTLRFFPNRAEQNCYIVPAYKQTLRYLVRVGFYYGNYDNLSNFPTFDLYIDNEKWATVDTSSTGGGPVYHEAIYVTHGSGYFKICVKQTREGEVPFVSLIQVVPLWANLYPKMETNATFHLLTRTNLGGDEVRYSGVYLDEKYNRIWTKGSTPLNCVNVPTLPDSNSVTENDPPYTVLLDSIQSNNSDPIILTVDLPQRTPQPAYFVFYFTENIQRSPNVTRTMLIKINDQNDEIVAAPDFGKNKVVTMYPVMVEGPTINITLAPNNGSTLPPLIAGMEVFTRTNAIQDHDKSSSTGTLEYFSFAYRTMLIKINDQNEEIVAAPDFGKNKVVTMYPVVVEGPTINITLAPNNGSTLPPLIAGMEVFTRTNAIQDHDKSSSTGTLEYFSFAYRLVCNLCLVVVLI
ncbi:unnamed protein product [Ilex paraguariensis]|uniref:Malectin-like domain-containing protein n=1 Tax=Ilex paraguariensis TaxID=185542 RepID=A0ABC8U8D9_9AQUA